MCTHLNIISMPPIRRDPESANLAGSTKASGRRATVMRSRTDLHVNSPQFNLHAVFPHVCVDPESANLEAQRHQGIGLQ